MTPLQTALDIIALVGGAARLPKKRLRSRLFAPLKGKLFP